MLGAKRLRIGTGAGFSADRLDPAVELVQHGELDAIIFECIGERTLAFGHRDYLANAGKGYNPLLERRLRAVLPLCAEHNTQLISNMGVANPNAAVDKAVEIARDLGLNGCKIGAVTGDDVTHLIGPDTEIDKPGMTVADVGRPMVGANAYLGADSILPALEQDLDVIITGRVADPSLFLAPIRHAFDWQDDEWPMLGAGTLVGHLMECAAQVTGGYFADPGIKDVPNLAYVGFPIAEIEKDGTATITKIEQTGGLVNQQTVKEQLLYEVHDPSAYVTPDVTADFSQVVVEEMAFDRVRVRSARGTKRPDKLKVTVAFDGGFLAEAGISYAGPAASGRAKLARDILCERMTHLHGCQSPLRFDLIGLNSLHGSAMPIPRGEIEDVRLRASLRTHDREQAELLLWEVEALLCCGPAGGGGYRGHISPSVITHSAFLDRDQIEPGLRIVEV